MFEIKPPLRCILVRDKFLSSSGIFSLSFFYCWRSNKLKKTTTKTLISVCHCCRLLSAGGGRTTVCCWHHHLKIRCNVWVVMVWLGHFPKCSPNYWLFLAKCFSLFAPCLGRDCHVSISLHILWACDKYSSEIFNHIIQSTQTSP